MHSGKGVLFNLDRGAALEQLTVDGGYEDRVDYIELEAQDTRGLCALRPT